MTKLIVREYLRVSKDTRRTGKSPDQQHNENILAFERQGFELHPSPAYRDVDRSASRYAKTSREDFVQLCADLEDDTFGADILALWESSRGSRKVSEWSRLIELCEKRNVRIWVTTHGRLYDPANARDRRSLHEDAVDAEYESDKTSERIRRNVRDAAQRGRPHGKNIYGYLRVYHPRTRELVSIEEHPEQASVVREAAERILDGESLYAIAKDFNLRGIPPRRPKRVERRKSIDWTPAAVKQMLSTPTYAGKRQYRGEVIGDAMWPPLIEEATWHKLQKLLFARQGERDNNWPAVHLLSGLVYCEVCGGPLRGGRQNSGRPRTTENGEVLSPKKYFSYFCSGRLGSGGEKKTAFHVAIKEDHLDQIVTAMLLARIRRPDFLTTIGEADDEVNNTRLRLLDEIDQLQSYLNGVREEAAKQLRFDLIMDQEARILPRIEVAQAELSRLAQMDPLVMRLISNLENLDESWEALEISEKRRVIRSIMAPSVSRVPPSRRGMRGLDPDRVKPGWR